MNLIHRLLVVTGLRAGKPKRRRPPAAVRARRRHLIERTRQRQYQASRRSDRTIEQLPNRAIRAPVRIGKDDRDTLSRISRLARERGYTVSIDRKGRGNTVLLRVITNLRR